MTGAITKLDELRAAALREVDDKDWFAWDEEIVQAWPGIARVIRAVEDYRSDQTNPSRDYTMVRQRREQMFDAIDALNQEVCGG